MIDQPDLPVILASASPRRKDLLTGVGLNFRVMPAQIDESLLKQESPVDHVRRLADGKAFEISHGHPDAIVIAADTIVVYREHILGKPVDAQDAYSMLNLLSGNTHHVITAVAIRSEIKNIHTLFHEQTEVCFRNLSDREISAYIAGGSPLDKAGAYGIQDLSANFVSSISGCFYNVIGFPLAAFLQKWEKLFGLS